MSLASNAPVCFVPTAKPEEARRFYEEVLGLTFIEDDQFAMVFRVGGHANGQSSTGQSGSMLRVVRAGKFEPFPFTIFGWEAPEIEKTVDQLAAKGVQFLRLGFLEQDERGIWRAPNGNAVAWFKDPDGNTLSLSKHD